ncbi:MAG: hypothetical protein LBJ64_06040, partial [Deltaproteobacteria bacterium]|nr:hypothetical protein [Deltaproteobacteria bacterium]
MAATKKHRKIVNQKPASFRVSGSGAARRKALVFEKVYPNEPISLGRANTLGVIILGKIISGDVKFLEPADSVVFPSEASIVPLYYFAETLRGAESSSARAERFRKSEAALDKMPDALDDLQEPFKTKGRMILDILSSWLEPGTEVFIEGLIYMAVQFGSAPFGPAQTEAAPPLPADEEMAAREPTAIDGVDVDGGGIGDLLPELPLPELAAPELPASGLAAPMLAAPGLAAFEGFGRDLSAPEGSASPLAAPELSAVESSALEPSSPGHPSLEPAARHLASHHQ